ncbi:type II RES/Xre toxin-antitoxin system antitoxin [Tellurirhabdus rosea]|uniref:type II RES/Xre toxin-antitoxin system antitoxin n=1 Tax=Tellurirhabdus rosea TaxID=2674997 RepID=UPI00225AD93D|nr:antitoxin Xre/MbcA/ParS toxin-binding domain-containing protein [Tellurirhabdus rosea]
MSNVVQRRQIPQDRSALVLLALQGIPAAAFFDIAEQTGYRREQLAEVFDTSVKTFQRYEREDRKLNPQDSEKALKIMALFEKGEELFGSNDHFRRWMDKPAFGLGSQVPFDLLHTSGGIDLIMDELTRIEYGDLA